MFFVLFIDLNVVYLFYYVILGFLGKLDLFINIWIKCVDKLSSWDLVYGDKIC